MVQRCIKADKSAWDEFVDKYSRLIYRYVLAVLKVYALDVGNAEDIFQEIFVLLRYENFKKLSSYKGRNKCSFASWLRQVTINHTIDFCRKQRPVVYLDDSNGQGFDLQDILVDAADPSDKELEKKENYSLLVDCISQLSADDKLFVEMHFSQGLTIEELGNLLRISRSAADMRKSRVIDRLKECFKLKGFL